MEPKRYKLETSPDGDKWTLRAAWNEGDPSRFGQTFSPEVALTEARAFKDAWLPQSRAYSDDVKSYIRERKFVRIIIEI